MVYGLLMGGEQQCDAAMAITFALREDLCMAIFRN